MTAADSRQSLVPATTRINPRVRNGAMEHLGQAAVWLLDNAAAGILGNLVYERAKALVQRWRVAGGLSRDDATHAAEMR